MMPATRTTVLAALDVEIGEFLARALEFSGASRDRSSMDSSLGQVAESNRFASDQFTGRLRVELRPRHDLLPGVPETDGVSESEPPSPTRVLRFHQPLRR